MFKSKFIAINAYIKKYLWEGVLKMKVFLGGTCNGSTWREKVIPNLKIDYLIIDI